MSKRKVQVLVKMVATRLVPMTIEVEEGQDPTDLTREERREAVLLANGGGSPDWAYKSAELDPDADEA